MSDEELAAAIRKSIQSIADLMNEADTRGIQVSFSIPKTKLMCEDPPREAFAPLIDIKKVMQL